jgi:eukaryotic-like serine/threonine-protein kinase
MMCPDDNVLGRLLDRAVDDAEHAQLEAHLDACEGCARLVAELARGTPAELDATLPSTLTESLELEVGVTVGRFTLVERLGAGGMGVVWAAYDPQLDRKIALKFVRAGFAQPEMLVRIAREAKALARVNHPNVVAVHDIGSDRGRIYIAQELVAGCDLGAWLAARPRDVREISGVFVQAARGLAAAHSAGIVHRDFKPSNVRVGDDGRVRVVDFGVARSQEPDDDRVVEVTPARAVEPRLTVTGAAVGTPLYMSPEQHLGERSDARSDQFSFCVALAEALYGEVPFTGSTAADYSIAVLRGHIRPAPPGTRVPGWLRAIVLRGLSGNRDDRFPTMDAVIAALEADPSRARRRYIAGAAAALVLCIGAAGVVYAAGDHSPTCTGGRGQLAQVWNDQQRSAARSAFFHTELPFAGIAWSRVERVLDGYGNDWIAAHKATCEATVRGEQSSRAMDLRMSCLDQRLQQMAAAADMLARADHQIVERAGDITSGLASIRGCADLATLQAITPPPQEASRKRDVDAIRAELAAIKATKLSGKYQDALPAAQAAVKRARAAAYPPLLADALLLLGQLQLNVRDDKAAEATLREAYAVAIGAGHGGAATLAAATLLQVVGIELARGDDGEWWAQIAKAGIANRATHDRTLAADVAMKAAELATVRGRHDEAITALRGALEIVVATDPLRTAMIHGALGEALFHAGKYSEALDEHRQALALYEAELGSEHPNTAIPHNGIGVALEHLGKFEQAMVEHRRALAIFERSFGADHPDVAGTRNNIAIVLADQMKLAEALAEYQQVLAIQVAKLGADHPNVAHTHQNLGALYRRMGKPESAIAEFRRQLSIMEKAFGPDHTEVGSAHYNLGTGLEDQAQDDAALVQFRAALAVWSHALSAQHPKLGFAHNAIGMALAQQGKFSDALPELEQGLAIEEAALGADHVNLAGVHDNLGMILHNLHRDIEALAHHRRALAILDAQKVSASPRDHAIMIEHIATALLATGAASDAIAELEPVLSAADQLADPELVAQLQFDLAQALWTAQRDRARAKQLARTARDIYRKLPAHDEERRVQAWLASR